MWLRLISTEHFCFLILCLQFNNLLDIVDKLLKIEQNLQLFELALKEEGFVLECTCDLFR
jgi:hypothetical protein